MSQNETEWKSFIKNLSNNSFSTIDQQEELFQRFYESLVAINDGVSIPLFLSAHRRDGSSYILKILGELAPKICGTLSGKPFCIVVRYSPKKFDRFFDMAEDIIRELNEKAIKFLLTKWEEKLNIKMKQNEGLIEKRRKQGLREL